jgi:ribonucleoside-diphosphate reductase alpha chain
MTLIHKKMHKKDNLSPTPSLPAGLSKVDLSENALQILNRRYIRHGDDGKLAESTEEMFWRVAYHIAKVENEWGKPVEERAIQFYESMVSKKFFPNSPTFTGAGTPLGQLAACFVLPISDDMGKTSSGIFQTLRDAALIQQTGGGNGFSFSGLRPKGSQVNSSAGQATGPVGFLRVYDNAFGEIAQGGTRRGANMAVLRVEHPDIEEFIECKTNETHITNFNISVGVSDDFMKAVENDEMWDLKFPDVLDERYHQFEGSFEQASLLNIPLITHKQIRARELFNHIVAQAHHNGEPGLLFLDTANRGNPVPHLYHLEATNPCGEQWLGPYESCCLGSINLSQFFGDKQTIRWDELQKSVKTAVIFLDDVINANHFVPAVPQLKENALRARRIGLGMMGLADLMFHVGVRYGSSDGQELASQVIEFIRFHAMQTSIELAKERGAFPAIKGSIYDPENITWQVPHPLMEYQHDWGRPELNWEIILDGIQKHGIRNAAQTTIAPTGTIGTVAGCEGYGCEPLFALAYTRHVNDNGKDLALTYASPLFEQALVKNGTSEEKRKEIIDLVMRTGSCQKIDNLPEDIRHIFVVSQDINAEEHVRMQAAMQAFVDNSLSKTINFPADASQEEIANAYILAWKLGCKGITVYLTGSREKEVLETAITVENKEVHELITPLNPEYDQVWLKESEYQPRMWSEAKKPRPRFLPGQTFGIETPVGKTFVTINENGHRQPFEVFINTAKAGTDVAADSEAIGRLISYILRISSPIEPSQRLQEVWRQVNGLGGGRTLGFGPNRVRSLPDGVAQVLAEYMENRAEHITSLREESEPAAQLFTEESELGNINHNSWEKARDQQTIKIGDICPECGQAAVINEEGCRKCYACGYSEC